MSRILVNEYFREIDRLRKHGGTTTEQVIREAFKDLLKAWAKSSDLIFFAELDYETPQKTKVRPDGTVLHGLRVPLGWWEAKDTADDLDTEISKKLSRGYPQSNIIFENSDKAVLIQNRQEVVRCDMQDGEALERLVKRFFDYERPEIEEFRKAIEQFKADLPHVLGALRERIDDAYSDNDGFRAAAARFLEHARETINPTLGEADVREMLIQHILTEEIFAHVFNQGDFHRENNIAQKLYELEGEFFKGAVKHETLKALQPYYTAIRANAAQITGHGEKQKFLKVIYENFYKVYNPKAADRLGVVYTPNEIVRFMIEGADWLCDKHFGKRLIDPGIEILDPATGTGTFVCELIEHFRGQPEKLHRKYKEELHANEVAILPYYVANLNIEATYAEVSGQYAEYPNLCFVDTLDNVAGLGLRRGHQHELFGAISDENVARVQRQNARTISVIIGNPPYNANQQNENDNNKNREYRQIDRTIRDTYVAQSTAQKTKVYDMYARFFRWATDRLGDEGIIAFITNRSFVESRTFDGFRKCVAEDFADIYVVDLGGDVRANPKISGTKHNVFGIQTGVAIGFMVKRKAKGAARILYARRPEYDTRDDKLTWLSSTDLEQVRFERVEPDMRHNWINLAENEWDAFLPVAEKETKFAKHPRNERAIFKLTSQGIKSNRDDWSIAASLGEVRDRIRFLLDRYSEQMKSIPDADDELDSSIKWTRKLKSLLRRRHAIKITPDTFSEILYRPFVKRCGCRLFELNEDLYQTAKIFPLGIDENPYILIRVGSRLEFTCIASEMIPNYAVYSLDPSEMLPRHRYTASGKRVDNITDWALRQFRDHYGPEAGVTKDAIFNYVYAVLHDPIYRKTYAINLKREFPRIPFYPNFRRWAGWGARLMELHIGYETVEPWPLTRRDIPDEKAREAGVAPAVKLKADKANGIIVLDSETQLSGVPAVAWEYRLGNRSGIGWVLDQHKEKTPRDPTIRERFNTYRFADHKERVIDLLGRVARVSVETMEIVEAMRRAKRDEPAAPAERQSVPG